METATLNEANLATSAELNGRAEGRHTAVYNGTYTITSPTGEHRTFKISTKAADASFAPGKRIISLLTGSDLCAESPQALLLRLKGTRQVLELPWGAAFTRAASLKASANALARINNRRNHRGVSRGRI